LSYIGGGQEPFHQPVRIGAAAPYAVKGGHCFGFRGPGVLFQQGFCGQDLSGIAVSAVFNPRLGKPPEYILILIGLGKSLYGDNLASPDPKGRDKAGWYHISVKYHRTYPANSGKASAFSPRQVKGLPEYIQKTGIRFGTYHHIFTV
jgi:hypothetical protein